MNNKYLNQKLKEAQIEASYITTVLNTTPWWRFIRNKNLRKKLKSIDKLLTTYWVDYEQVMDAVMSEQEQKKWADPTLD